jgi:hypothetical protein
MNVVQRLSHGPAPVLHLGHILTVFAQRRLVDLRRRHPAQGKARGETAIRCPPGRRHAQKPAVLCEEHHIVLAAAAVVCGHSQDHRACVVARNQGDDHVTPGQLRCARMRKSNFCGGHGSAASAGEECSQLYKICNWSCDRTINAVDNFLVCKSQCDRRLITCDRRSINASTFGGRSLPGLTPQGDGRCSRRNADKWK